MSETSNYMKFRGKCKELSEAACAADPTLTLVRGHYYCPIWNTKEPHWWTKRVDGTIYDPTVLQFPSEGQGEYTEFDGTFECSECGESVKEENARFASNYVFCSDRCYGRFVGVYD